MEDLAVPSHQGSAQTPFLVLVLVLVLEQAMVPVRALLGNQTKTM
jgi:hypothetical protein